MKLSVKWTGIIAALLAVILLVTAVTQKKFQNLGFGNGYKFVSIQSVEKDLECLALNIYREAGYESFEGKVAVAQVTLNRVAHPEYPKSVCGVVYEKNVFYSKVVCQFSWYCDANHRNRKINEKAFEDSYEVAKKVYLEGFRLTGLQDALYYHADYVNPQWKFQKVAKIGTHIFYKERSNAGS